MNFWQGIKRDRYLLLALAIGFVLRTTNPTFGSPSLYVSNDEAVAHLSALNMIAERTPVSIANYTPLGAYFQIPFLAASFGAMKIIGYVQNVSDFEFFVLTHEGYFLFIPRLISGLFGTLTILVIYKITHQLFLDKKIAILSAFLTAVSFNLVHISHFGKPWAAALFFFVLSVYFVLRNKNLLSFISVGLSYGFHQVGVLAIPLIFLLTKKKLAVGNLLSMVLMILMIVIFNSLTLKTGLIDSVRRDQSFLKEGKFLADFLIGSPDLVASAFRSFWGNLSVFFTANLFVTDGVILIFSVWGIIKNFGASDKKKWIVYYILIYFIFASLFFHPLLRYLLPVILILIPFTASGIATTFGKKNLLIVVVLLVASFNSLWWNWLYLKKPTFISSQEWIKQNINPNEWLGYSGKRYYTFVPGLKAIDIIQMVNPGSYNRLRSFFMDTRSDNVRNIVFLSDFYGNNSYAKLASASHVLPISYVVDYYLDPHDRLYNTNETRFKVAAHFSPLPNDRLEGLPEPLFDPSWNFATSDRREKVSMYSLERIGPYVDILKVKSY